MSGKFEISKAQNGKFMFHLKAGNGEVILNSQMYDTKASAVQGIDSVKANASQDERYVRATSSDGKPYFNLKAANGQVIGSSELYSSAAAMENGIASVKKNAEGASTTDLS